MAIRIFVSSRSKSRSFPTKPHILTTLFDTNEDAIPLNNAFQLALLSLVRGQTHGLPYADGVDIRRRRRAGFLGSGFGAATAGLHLHLAQICLHSFSR